MAAPTTDVTPTPSTDPPKAEPTEPAKPAEPASQPEPAQEPKETDWKAESRKWETRAKENAEKAKAHDAYVESQKTETQKLADAKAAAEQAAEKAKTEALRYKIASKHQISDEDAEAFLTGADEGAITAQAERLVALQGSGKKFKGSGDGGAVDRKSGVSQLTKADLPGMTNEQINKARKEGRLDRAMGKTV